MSSSPPSSPSKAHESSHQLNREKTGNKTADRRKMRDKGTLSSTDRLVMNLRLRKIEQEHTSTGTLLDTRRMYDLDEAEKFRVLKARNSDKYKKRDVDLFDDPPRAVEADHKKDEIEDSLEKCQQYATEELIWKSKSSAPDYTLKRQFERPDLVDFLKNLSAQKKGEFKKECRQQFYKLCDRLRSKCMSSRMKMSDIFHPNANSHRAHCQYVMKLYKNITTENIEDPVLQKLKDEDEREKRAAHELTQKALNYSKQFEASSTSGEAKDGKAEEGNFVEEIKKESDSEEPRHSSPTSQVAGIKERKKEQMRSMTKLAPLRTVSEPRKAKKAPNIAQVADTAVPTTEDKALNCLDKLKIKRVKIGSSNPRDLLVADAEKFDSSVSKHSKRSLDKSDILEKKVSNWMLQTLQSNQISSAAGGYAFQLPSWKSLPSLHSAENIMLNSLKVQSAAISFDDFQRIFDKYVDTKNDEGSFDPSECTVEPQSVTASSEQVDDGKEDLDIVETLGAIDPNFQKYMTLVLRKRPEVQKIAKQSEKLEKKDYVITKTSHVGEWVSTRNETGLNKGFTTLFNSSSFARDHQMDESMINDNFKEEEDSVMLGIENDWESIHSPGTTGSAQDGDDIDNVDNGTEWSQSSLERPTSTPKRSRKRGFSRRRRNDSAGGGSAAGISEDDLVRAKLQDVWDILQVSTFSKLSFMRKYASSAVDFLRAVDTWAEAACGVFMLLQGLELLEKARRDLVVYPLGEHSVISLLQEPYLPATFGIVTNEVMPVAGQMPLSYLFIDRVKSYLHEEYRELEGGVVTSQQGVEKLVTGLHNSVIIPGIHSAIKYAHDELDDVLTFESKSLREWLSTAP